MKFWEADDESIDLIEAAAEMSIAAMVARSRRVDPDGIISRSHAMSAIKLRSCLGEIRGPHILNWSDFSDEQKDKWYEALNLFQAQTDAQLQSAAFSKLRYMGLCRPPFTKEIRERDSEPSPAPDGRKNESAATRAKSRKRPL